MANQSHSFIGRDQAGFQQPLTIEQITTLTARAFGSDAKIVDISELDGGLYNDTYRVTLHSNESMVLRVAPTPARQYRIERALMRKEHAALPYFAPIAMMVPQTILSDWTHDLIDRDYVWQTWMSGVPARDRARSFTREQWDAFYRQLGLVTAQVHRVAGQQFGPIGGVGSSSWSAAVLAQIQDLRADLLDTGSSVEEVDRLAAVASDKRAVLDQITQPRLLHGDLWIPNVLLAENSSEPVIVGVLDHDRASWGDPAADWGISQLNSKSAAEVAPFYDCYGSRDLSPDALWRDDVYRAIHLGATILERIRLGQTSKVPAGFEDLAAVVARLGSRS